MSLLRRRRPQKLSLTGRGLLLTILLGLTVPAIMTAPLRTPLIPKTQETAMMEKEANYNNDEGITTWVKTYRGNREDGGRCGEQTADGGYIIPGNTPPSGAGEEDVWLSKVSNLIGIEPIYIDSDYTLDSDLTFSGDGFIIESDYVILDLNGHTITGSESEGGSGVYLEGRTGVTVKNGTIDNFIYGILLENSSGTTLFGNTATHNMNHGFLLTSGSNNNNLTGNTASDNNYRGFGVFQSNGNTLSGNTATNTATNTAGIGFSLEHSNDTTLSGNTATNHYGGFALTTGSNNNLTENTATANTNGFQLEKSSDNNTLTGNTATASTRYGFRLHFSCNNTLSGNTATGNDDCGFRLENSSYNTTLSGNNATDNDNSGFYLGASRDNTLSGNTATNNRDGFHLSGSHDNTLSGNTATNNRDGFHLSGSRDNTLSGNNATDNDGYGIFLTGSASNTIYNNYFDNDHNASDSGTNAWNIDKTPGTNIIRGSYIGGNFWSDYPEGDADGDGLGDIPYTIPGGDSRDDLPLFDPTVLGAFPIPGGVISILLATLLLVILPVRRRKRKSR